MFCIQLDIGQKVARDISHRALTVHREVAFRILAGQRPLRGEQRPVLGLQKPQRPLPRRQLPRLSGGRQSVEVLLELAVRVVPYHNAPPRRPGKRLGKPPEKLLAHIQLSHACSSLRIFRCPRRSYRLNNFASW